jgi:hypothetical protein
MIRSPYHAVYIYILAGPSQYLPITPYKTIDFPQPARPFSSYYQEHYSSQPDQTSFSTVISDNMGRQTCGPEERSADQHAPATTMEAGGEKETREELWGAILELYEKLPQRIKNKVNLEKFDVHRDVSRDLKVDSSSRRSVEGSTIKKLSRKLERFKIRTVQGGGGVVKVEEDRS